MELNCTLYMHTLLRHSLYANGEHGASAQKHRNHPHLWFQLVAPPPTGLTAVTLIQKRKCAQVVWLLARGCGGGCSGAAETIDGQISMVRFDGEIVIKNH